MIAVSSRLAHARSQQREKHKIRPQAVKACEGRHLSKDSKTKKFCLLFVCLTPICDQTHTVNKKIVESCERKIISKTRIETFFGEKKMTKKKCGQNISIKYEKKITHAHQSESYSRRDRQRPAFSFWSTMNMCSFLFIKFIILSIWLVPSVFYYQFMNLTPSNTCGSNLTYRNLLYKPHEPNASIVP